MRCSDIIMAIITLISGFGGVWYGAKIINKSAIEQKKTEILSKILDRSYTGSELLSIVAQVAMIFKSQTIDPHLNKIFEIYLDKDKYPDKDLPEKLRNQFIELAKSMRENLGISTEVLTNEFIKNAIAGHSYTR